MNEGDAPFFGTAADFARYRGADPAVALQAHRRQAEHEERAADPRRARRPRHLLPRRRRHRVRPGGQPDPVHRRRHQPVRVRRLHADRRAPGPQPRVRRTAHGGQHERPAGQDPAHPSRSAGRLLDSGREPVPGGHAADPPRDLCDGLPQPVPDRDQSRQRRHLRRRLLAGQPQREPAARSLRAGQVDDPAPAGQLRLALLRDRPAAICRLRLRHRGVRRDLQLRQSRQRVAAQHGPEAAASGDATRRLVLVRPVRGLPAAREHPAGRHRPDGRSRVRPQPGEGRPARVAGVLRRRAAVLRVDARLHQGVPAERGRPGRPDQPGAGDARVADPRQRDGSGVRAGGRALLARVRRRVLQREPGCPAGTDRLHRAQRQPCPAGCGCRPTRRAGCRA